MTLINLHQLVVTKSRLIYQPGAKHMLVEFIPITWAFPNLNHHLCVRVCTACEGHVHVCVQICALHGHAYGGIFTHPHIFLRGGLSLNPELLSFSKLQQVSALCPPRTGWLTDMCGAHTQLLCGFWGVQLGRSLAHQPSCLSEKCS